LARIVAGKALTTLQPEWVRLEASNSDEALALMAERKIDVMLIDFNMPGRDGLDLAAKVRATHPTMPIAIITANVQDEVIARARALNTTFVGKPITEDTLRGFTSGANLRLRAEQS
jgi:CheY-like chemotaxis protein